MNVYIRPKVAARLSSQTDGTVYQVGRTIVCAANVVDVAQSLTFSVTLNREGVNAKYLHWQ